MFYDFVVFLFYKGLVEYKVQEFQGLEFSLLNLSAVFGLLYHRCRGLVPSAMGLYSNSS